MQAAVIDQAGSPESFRMIKMPVPAPKHSEVIIRQKYAAVNFGDVIRRKRGLFPADARPPYVLGFEGAGVISEVGESVTGLQVGQRVAYLAERGGYAGFTAVPASQTWILPEAVSDEAAAGITCVGLTAFGLIVQSAIRPADIALVHGAAGGVGSILLQMLALQGVRAVAVVRGKDKQEFVSKLGAEVVVDSEHGDIQADIRRVAPGGVDVIFDCVGQDVLGSNLAVIKSGGKWMYFGSTSGHAQFPGDRILMNRLSLRGFVVFDFARDTWAWQQGTAFLSSGLAREHLKAQTTQIFPLTEVSKAHQLLESRMALGKIILAL